MKSVKSLIFEGKIVIQDFVEENLVKMKGVKSLREIRQCLRFCHVIHDLAEKNLVKLNMKEVKSSFYGTFSTTFA